MKVEEKGDGEYYVIYKPSLHGKHTINIKFGGEHIAKSPFHVDVVSSKKDAIPSKVKAYGPGRVKSFVFYGKTTNIFFRGRGTGWDAS